MPPGPARSLSHDEILDAAFAELAARGPSALSLRGVASRVGLAAAALYTYFPSKRSLMRGMVERLLAGIDGMTDASASASPRERMHLLAVSTHEALSAHPGAASLLMSGPLEGPHALRVNELLIDGFVDAGLSQDDAARASYALQVYVLGTAILASVGEEAAETHASSHEVASESFPLTAATVDVAAQHDSSGQFLWGLDRVLDGLLAPVRGS